MGWEDVRPLQGVTYAPTQADIPVRRSHAVPIWLRARCGSCFDVAYCVPRPAVGGLQSGMADLCVLTSILLKYVFHLALCWADFQVTEELPGITFALPNNYAGNIKVQRPNHDNDTLFFWGFEHAEGSLTAAAGENQDAPWAVWLQGGCVPDRRIPSLVFGLTDGVCVGLDRPA